MPALMAWSSGWTVPSDKSINRRTVPPAYRKGKIRTRCGINAAGIYADVFNNMVSEEQLRITPRRGEYLLLDQAGGFLYAAHDFFRMPGPMGKGVLITPTVHGNLLVGPTAQDVPDRNVARTTAERTFTGAKSMDGIKALPLHETITSFAGLSGTWRTGGIL